MAKREINTQTGKAFRQKGSCDVSRMKWVSENGSIFTEEIVESKGDSVSFVKARISIAFNVGDVSDYIVNIHNNRLDAVRREMETEPEILHGESL